MIRRLLIANRGEIALRIIKSCKKLGIETISVGSQAEIGHPHLLHADLNLITEKQTPAEVYLDSSLLVDLARKHNADAIHPGYGFLSEQAEFAEKVKNSGIIFIGPSAATLNALGDKAQTRQLAISLGVPVAPGYDSKDQSEKNLLKQANSIGFPLLLKAVMGGGGRGMRKVQNQSDFLAELKSTQQEAKRLYNNSAICIEKLIVNPRHIEVQVAGDKDENYIHLFERDCSIQRRFQKIVEFSPAQALDQKMLNTLYEYALKVAKGSKLEGLATMEFLVSSKDIYFLEANPRIQVEHPVTELVTDLDLIELQIKIANGDSIKEIKPKLRGFAAEARVYAEIPEQDYLPSTGNIRALNLPNFLNSFKEQNGIRYDHALFCGFKINQHFDPMLVKVILKSDSYEALRISSLNALRDFYIQGIETNLALLISLFSDTKVFEFAAKELEEKRLSNDCSQIAAIVAFIHPLLNNSNSVFKGNWRNNGLRNQNSHIYHVGSVIADKEKVSLSISLIERSSNEFKIKIGNKELTTSVLSSNLSQIILKVNRVVYSAHFSSLLHIGLTPIEIQIDGRTHLVSKTTESDSISEKSKDLLLSPLPGKITKIHVAQGQKVSPGDCLISIESMKIEHSLKLPQSYNSGTIIEKICVEEGSNINAHQELIKYTTEE